MAFAPRQRNTAKPVTARGKPTGSSTAKFQKPAEERQPKPTRTAVAASASQNSSTSSRSAKPSASTRRAPTGAAESKPAAPAVKSRSASASTSSKNASISKPSSSVSKPQEPAPSWSQGVDPLQTAAQLQSWLYMSSNLQNTFKSAQKSTQSALDERAKELIDDEAEISDQRVRFDVERRIAFFEELEDTQLSHEVPRIMRAFLRNGENCDKLVSEALRISTQGSGPAQRGLDQSPLLRHKDILNQLEEELSEGVQLDKWIGSLLESKSLSSNSQSILGPILIACRPLVLTRIENLTIAQELIRSSKDNLGTSMHIQSLRIS